MEGKMAPLQTGEDKSNSPHRPQPGSSRTDRNPTATPDLVNAAMEIERGKEVYKAHKVFEEKPGKIEVWGWYSYELCSYFVGTFLVPVLFPLMISQIVHLPPEPANGWSKSLKGVDCVPLEMYLYERVAYKSIEVSHLKLSPLVLTSISWAIGLVIATPVLKSISFRLDFANNHQLITMASIVIGALFCLPTGFFRTVWIFPPYIAVIVAAHTVASTSHTRQLGLIIRGFTGPSIQNYQIPIRRTFSGWTSSIAAAIGGIGSAIFSAFTFHMLRLPEGLVSLWVVSIFSGLKWLLGIFHVFLSNRAGSSIPDTSETAHTLLIFTHPHALGALFAVFLSSFTTMCIFTGGILYLVGQLCFSRYFLLYLWLTYFLAPLLLLPLLQPLQHLISADAAKMQVLGFLLSAVTAGIGFTFRDKNWHKLHVLLFAALQSTSTGLLHAFGRVLLLDCSPTGREGVFSMWFSWVRAVGLCIGFGVASAAPASLQSSFVAAFFSAVIGALLLIFGNINDFSAAVAAGHARDQDDSERETSSEMKENQMA